jgi:Protein of unknown function (DUF4199)
MDRANTTFNKWQIPVRWGLAISLINIILAMCVNLFLVNNMVPYFIMIFVVFVVSIVLLGIAAGQQRKAMGGYINIREAFQAVFVAILFITVTYTLYSYVYPHFIDKDFPAKLKASTLAWAEKMGAPQDKLDEASARADEQMKKSQSFFTYLQGILTSIVFYSIFGLICSAIVARKKPPFEQSQFDSVQSGS